MFTVHTSATGVYNLVRFDTQVTICNISVLMIYMLKTTDFTKICEGRYTLHKDMRRDTHFTKTGEGRHNKTLKKSVGISFASPPK